MFNLLRVSALFALLANTVPASLLYVADADDASIYTVSAGGGTTLLISGLAYPKAIALQAGILLVADGDEIKRFDALTGASLGTFAVMTGVDSIVVDLLGNVFAASSTGGEVSRFTAAGGTATHSFVAETPGSLALDDQGRLFVSQVNGDDGMQGNRYLAADLTPLGVFVAGGLNTPAAAVYQDGTLYISDLFEGIQQVDAAGLVTLFTNDGLSFAWGLAFDTNGDLYVANSLPGDVVMFSAAGTPLGPLASFTTPTGLAFAAVPEPASFLLLGSGILLVAGWRRLPHRV